MAKTPTRRQRRRAGASRQTRKSLARARRFLDHGDAAKAVALIEDVLTTDPSNAGARHLAGVVCYRSGDLEAALGHAGQALEAEPANPDYLEGFGVIQQALGRAEAAAVAFEKACEAEPGSARRHANLGFARRQAGDLPGALAAFADAVGLDPEHVNAYLGWVDLLGRATTPDYDADIAAQLLAALTGPLSAPEELAPAVAHQLRRRFDPTDDTDLPNLDPGDPLLRAYLGRCLNIDPALEAALRGHRRRLLMAARWTEADAGLAGLIARQGVINEYAVFAEPDEIEIVEGLEAGLSAALGAGAPSDDLLRYAMYRPLGRLKDAGQLAPLAPDDLGADLAEIITLSVRNPAREAAMKAEIPTLSAIADATSKKVRAQYEEHPYPRWTVPTPQAPSHPAADLRRLFPHLAPPSFLDDGLSILIAGCGTGRHVAQVAATYPGAAITAIDISLASIAYGKRTMVDLGIAPNVSFMQADILDAGRLEREFEMIQSVGVLHHMAKPLAGWRVLAGLLRPGGVMKIGLYSERGRRQVLRCRRIIAGEGIGSSDADMRAFRHRLMEGGAAANFDKVMARADFYSLSMCRDLLFHVQEVCYTPLRIKSELSELGLRFLGFEETEALGLNAVYRERFPQSPGLDDLDHWEELEASLDDPPEGYVFWCEKPA
ncbi:MAG: methyltransferase domain-containing protein [Magnetovibrio sp.]|nr:methyltransferase domain-containing protein [Magnetovibrio sp.]